jgi:hypothetical protein
MGKNVLKSSTGYQHTGIKKDTHVSGFKQSIYMPSNCSGTFVVCHRQFAAMLFY